MGVLRYADDIIKNEFSLQVGRKAIPIYQKNQETDRNYYSDAQKTAVFVKKNQINAYIKRKFRSDDNDEKDSVLPLSRILVDSEDVYNSKLEEFRRNLQEELVIFMRDYLDEIANKPPKKKQKKNIKQASKDVVISDSDSCSYSEDESSNFEEEEEEEEE